MASHLDDLFEDDVGVDDDVNDVDDVGRAAMPGFDDEAEETPMNEEAGDEDAEDGEEGEGGDVLAKLRALKRGAAKKRVMNPQPKLDAARLKSDRGLPILPKLFEGVQFKGKGHEARDLKLMMGKLEHWGHRLFPKMTFDELIARLEKLGGKKDVQTCIKRMRLDMPVLDEDFTAAAMYTSDNEDNELPPRNQEPDDFDAEEAYDEMIRQEREAMERRKQQEREEEEMEQDLNTSQDVTSQTPRRGTTEKATVNIAETGLTNTPTTNQTLSQSTPQGLTPEQKERLAMNKLRALEKRAARLGVPVASLLPQTPNECSKDDAEKLLPTSLEQDQRALQLAAKEIQSNTENDDVMQTGQNAIKASDLNEEVVQNDIRSVKNKLASKNSSQENANNNIAGNSEETLNLKLSESEQVQSEGVGTLRLSESNMDTNEEEQSRENDDVGTLRLSATEDTPVAKDNEDDSGDTTKNSPDEIGSLQMSTVQTEGIGTLKLSETEEATQNMDSVEMPPSRDIGKGHDLSKQAVDTNYHDLKNDKNGEDSDKLNSSLVGSGGEDEQGLCLQLSDSTNTTQEEDDCTDQ